MPSASELFAARQLFEAIDKDSSGTLDRDEILASGLFRSLGQCDGCTCETHLNCRSVDHFMKEVDANGDGAITFLEFMLKASRLLFGETTFKDMSPDVIESLLPRQTDSAAKLQLGERFEDILRTLRSWEGTAVSTEALKDSSRLSNVLAGLLAGAHIPDLTEALKTMYVDFQPLRLGGDLIFKLVKKLMEDKRKMLLSSSTTSDR